MVQNVGACFGGFARARPARLAALLVLLLGLTTVGLPSASISAGAAGSGVLIPWAPASENPASNQAPVPPAQAMQDAANFNFLTAHVMAYAGQVPAMKAVNPNLKIFAYMNATFAQSYQGSTFPKQDYELDATGHRITNIKSGNYLMNPSQSDWIQSRITECQSDVQQSGYDGCFLDLLGGAPIGANFVTAPPINPATNQAWTRAQWLAATANLAGKVRAAVHASTVYGHPVLVYGNGLSNGEQYYDPTAPSSVLIDSLDGGIAEAWLRQQASPASWHPTTSQWLQNVNMIADVEAKGKPLLIITKMWVTAVPAQQDAWREYALATYLMGTQGQSAFFFSTSFAISRTTLLPWYTTALGAPTGTYGLLAGSGVYQRTFATGLVLANADSKPHSVTLNRTYYTLDHQPITSTTMGPGTGLILTTS
jgi:hypothetical protein